MCPTATEHKQPSTPPREEKKPESSNQQSQNISHHDDEHDDEECLDSSVEHQTIEAAHHPITPAVHKRRQATKLHMVQSPTDNIFSPISKKLLGRKRTDIVKELPEF